jgi:hypothetical protein
MMCKKHVIERKLEGRIEHGEDEGEDVSSLWMTVRKGADTVNKEEALDRTVWRTGFGRGCGPVIRQTMERMTCTWIVANRRANCGGKFFAPLGSDSSRLCGSTFVHFLTSNKMGLGVVVYCRPTTIR